MIAIFPQNELNTKPDAWVKLSQESDIEILSALLWSWLDSLKEPVIDKNAMVYLVLKSEKPVDAMKKLNEEVKYTCEYLIRFIARLRPPNEEIAHLLLCRL